MYHRNPYGRFERLGIQDSLGFDQLHEHSIITHSTAIEGSTVTFEENVLMFVHGIIPAGKTVHEQMMNLDLKHAYDVARDIACIRTPITCALLKGLSALVMRNTETLYRTLNGEHDESRGAFCLRNVSAGRGGHSHLAWQKVAPRTAEFCEWHNHQLDQIDRLPPTDVYQLSFETNHRLITIHPWSDGNGRMSRLLMNIAQMEGTVVPRTYAAVSRRATSPPYAHPVRHAVRPPSVTLWLKRRFVTFRQGLTGTGGRLKTTSVGKGLERSIRATSSEHHLGISGPKRPHTTLLRS